MPPDRLAAFLTFTASRARKHVTKIMAMSNALPKNSQLSSVDSSRSGMDPTATVEVLLLYCIVSTVQTFDHLGG